MSWSSAGHFNEALINSATGAPIISGGYQIFQSDGTTLATIYSNAARSTTRPQPLTTDSSGNAEFYAEPGDGYILRAGTSTETINVPPQTADLAALLTAAQTASDTNFNGHVVSGNRDLIRNQTGTSYSFNATTDDGATLRLNNASAITLTLPNNATAGDGAEIIQTGAGVVTIVVASGATLNNAHSHTKTNGQHAAVRVKCMVGGSSSVWNLAGDTSA